VTFTGRVPDAELLAMLNTADVCVNPDVANEMNDISTMNKIMEYMSLGKPIVQFDLTEGRFSAQEPRSTPGATTRRLRRKIVELLDDPAQRAGVWAPFGRRRVRRTSWNARTERAEA
jgi:glycosyltransferase involved in cell wall biosynthesis